MRVLVFFDLPTKTVADRRAYRHFRKFLLTNGFIMLQESVYSKLTTSRTTGETIKNNVRDAAPKSGNIMLCDMTEEQYARIAYLNGQPDSEYITSTERIIII